MSVSAVAFGLTSLAIGGFAPGGRLSPVALIACACGLMLLSGPPSPSAAPVPA
jgi:hypothetical protein